MEVAAPNFLARTHTAPTAVRSRVNTYGGLMPNSHKSSSSAHYSSYSQPSTRSSDSTQGTSQSTLFSPPPPVPPLTPINNGAPLEASNNVLNTRANKDASLFQTCLSLRLRLKGLPEVEESLLREEHEAEEDTDPVTLLWRTFRKGYPLMTIYNALNPVVPLEVDPNKVPDKRKPQAATYKFLQACLTELKFPSDSCFIIADLYGDDTTGFVKVVRVINRVLDVLVQAGLLSSEFDGQSDESSMTVTTKRTQRQHIIEELVKTERTYVQHLELLQAFKKQVEERGVIPGDAIHDIFLNLNALLDFQRRFLIRVEQTNAAPEHEQNWGKLFVLYKDAFKVYEPYIANQKKCEEIAMREYDKLKDAGGSPELRQMVESPSILSSFLLKPFQRLAKYPLLLKELRDKGDLDDERKYDISVGIEAASAVLQRTNAAVDKEEREEAVAELRTRVEDWKGHRIEGFGELLLHGTFTVLKADSLNSKDPEREYKIYLFEMILLCCKEMNPNKQKNKFMNKPTVDKNGRPKLQLKGRIFMQNVTETVSISKPGSYTCQIFWKGDPGIENFIIRFSAEETMKKWCAQVDAQRRVWRDAARTSNHTQTSTSATEFTYMKNHELENPYRQDEDDDDDVDTVVSEYPYSTSRTESRISGRSRSGTGDSIIGGMMPVRALPPSTAPPRFPMGQHAPQLHLQTQNTMPEGAGTTSPGERGMDSYFSPSIDSPVSTRTSSSSNGMFPFPRQSNMLYHMNGGDENHPRFTAPSMGRPNNQLNGYQINARNAMQRPSLPPNLVSQQSSMNQNRLRSASSPDIQNSVGQRRMPPQGGPPPPVPEIPHLWPTHPAYTPGILNRSQSNSPNQMSLPSRTGTQSPNVQHQRLMQQPRSVPMHNQLDYPSSGPVQYASMRAMGPEQRGYPPGSLDQRTLFPPLPTIPQDSPAPMQLKVKVHCPSAGSSMTLVVSTSISYQSLKDRIDAKLQRSTNVSLSAGQVKLKYVDDDDFVSIQSDEDVQTAFESWKEQQKDQIMTGQMGEIELYCQR